MKTRMTALVLAAVFLAMAPGARAAGTAAAVIRMDFDLSGHDRKGGTELWVPYPLSSRDQDVGAVGVSGDFAGSAVYADKKYRTPILYARWPAGAASRRLSLVFRVRRVEVRRRDFPGREPAWNPGDYAMWLAPTSLGPVDGPVKELAMSIVKGKKTVLARARAIYDWVCENMYRDPATRGCGKGDVCLLLARPGGKCTDIHSVFVALCRAAGVPAREIFGVRIGRKDVQDISKWQHCWAEFFLPGYGWVPVDPADVRKLMLKRGLKLSDPRTAELRRYFWGGWDAWRFELARGRDIVLVPPQQGAPLNTFGYPYAEVAGRPMDFYDPAAFSYSFTSYRITEHGYAMIDTAGLGKLVDGAPDVMVFDARSPEEYRDAHIRGASSLPVEKFAGFSRLLPADRARMIVFYCNGVKCGKSRRAAEKALALGYENVLVYAEGMPVWEEKGMPVESGPGPR